MSTKKDNKNSIGERFAEERKRISLSQKQLADACGKTREAIGKYERNLMMPGGDVLSVCYELGFDIKYVLTGVPSDDSPRLDINPRIKDLSEDQQKMVNHLIEELAKANEKTDAVKGMADNIQSILNKS